MQKYKSIFSSLHSAYRLITSFNNSTNFAVGVCRLYRNTFDTDKVVMICKNISAQGFLKIILDNKKPVIKKGGISILTSREREIIKQEKEIILDNSLVYPFVFDESMGVAYIMRHAQDEPFSIIEKKWFATLSEEVSVGLKVCQLYREENKIMQNYIKSLTSILHEYVPTSSLHIKCVFRLIRAMGKEMKLSEIEAKSLEYASLLHDAGKIGVPYHLLKKQQPLTDEELKIMRKHPRRGAEMIKSMDILKPVMPIILHHHERYDGKGYPSRLKKEQIPLNARILAVIDAFDAMYFGRPYKQRRQIQEIEMELRKGMGTQFDPKVVVAFLKILERKDIKRFLRTFS